MDETAIVVALVLGLLVGSAFGYFSYRAMSMNDEPVPALEPQPQVRDHNHLGLWFVLLILSIVSSITARAVQGILSRG